jgi:hypothetical protein
VCERVHVCLCVCARAFACVCVCAYACVCVRVRDLVRTTSLRCGLPPGSRLRPFTGWQRAEPSFFHSPANAHHIIITPHSLNYSPISLTHPARPPPNRPCPTRHPTPEQSGGDSRRLGISPDASPHLAPSGGASALNTLYPHPPGHTHTHFPFRPPTSEPPPAPVCVWGAISRPAGPPQISCCLRQRPAP